MAKITFSVVITALNEADSIGQLLDSLINQSVLPKEIIVVDGGSTDETEMIVEAKRRHAKIPIRILVYPQSNRSAARNYGIDKAESEYIAVTDAGCVAEPNWLEYLSSGFRSETEAVAGFYRPKIDKPIQEIFARYTCVSPEKFDPKTFLPSSRSVAFTKSIWQEVGGYPENLNTCEDLVFAKKLFNTGKLMAVKQAVVVWNQPQNYGQFMRQIAGYAQGDVEARYWPHIVKILSIWGRYLAFIFLPWLMIIYLGFILRKQLHVKTILVQLVADIGVMWGSLKAVGRLTEKKE